MPGTICSRTPEHKRNVISFITRLRSLTPTVHLEREPGQGEKSHHHHQHLDDLELTIYIVCSECECETALPSFCCSSP